MKRSIFVLFLFAVSCSKFEHTDLDLNPACELCEWAEAREGVYTGIMYGNVSGGSAGDSTSFEVQQVFLNHSDFDDSTRMYFQVTETRQNGVVYQSIGSTLDSTGVIFGVGDNWDDYEFTMKGDSIIVYKGWFGVGWTYFSINGVFYK